MAKGLDHRKGISDDRETSDNRGYHTGISVWTRIVIARRKVDDDRVKESGSTPMI